MREHRRIKEYKIHFVEVRRNKYIIRKRYSSELCFSLAEAGREIQRLKKRSKDGRTHIRITRITEDWFEV